MGGKGLLLLLLLYEQCFVCASVCAYMCLYVRCVYVSACVCV